MISQYIANTLYFDSEFSLCISYMKDLYYPYYKVDKIIKSDLNYQKYTKKYVHINVFNGYKCSLSEVNHCFLNSKITLK